MDSKDSVLQRSQNTESPQAVDLDKYVGFESVSEAIARRAGAKWMNRSIEALEDCVLLRFQVSNLESVYEKIESKRLRPIFEPRWLSASLEVLAKDRESVEHLISDFWYMHIGWASCESINAALRFTTDEPLRSLCNNDRESDSATPEEIRDVLPEQARRCARRLGFPQWTRALVNKEKRIISVRREYPGWFLQQLGVDVWTSFDSMLNNKKLRDRVFARIGDDK